MCVCLRLIVGYAVLKRLASVCVYIHEEREIVCVCACASLSGTRCSDVLLVCVNIYVECVRARVCVSIYIMSMCVGGMRCRDWSSHASRTMSSIKTNVYGAALEYGLEDHKGVESCRRQQITS